MLLFLMGMPGVGKSHWLRRFGEGLNFREIDLDEEIVQRTGKTIPELIQISEHYFRECERESLKTVIANNKSAVIALGGGTPCFFDNLAVIKKSGKSIWIRLSIERIRDNILSSKDIRPLINNVAPLEDQLKQLSDLRTPFYAQADLYFNPEKDDFLKFLSEITRFI